MFRLQNASHFLDLNVIKFDYRNHPAHHGDDLFLKFNKRQTPFEMLPE